MTLRLILLLIPIATPLFAAEKTPGPKTAATATPSKAEKIAAAQRRLERLAGHWKGDSKITLGAKELWMPTEESFRWETVDGKRRLTGISSVTVGPERKIVTQSVYGIDENGDLGFETLTKKDGASDASEPASAQPKTRDTVRILGEEVFFKQTLPDGTLWGYSSEKMSETDGVRKRTGSGMMTFAGFDDKPLKLRFTSVLIRDGDAK